MRSSPKRASGPLSRTTLAAARVSGPGSTVALRLDQLGARIAGLHDLSAAGRAWPAFPVGGGGSAAPPAALQLVAQRRPHRTCPGACRQSARSPCSTSSTSPTSTGCARIDHHARLPVRHRGAGIEPRADLRASNSLRWRSAPCAPGPAPFLIEALQLVACRGAGLPRQRTRSRLFCKQMRRAGAGASIAHGVVHALGADA